MKGTVTLLLLIISIATASAQISTNSNWTWTAGDSTANSTGNYVDAGSFSGRAYPAARRGAISAKDTDGNIWIYGGYSDNDKKYYSDLWVYAPGKKQWCWYSGSKDANIPANYGSVGVSSPNNTPGGRFEGSAIFDASGNLWLFGGVVDNVFFNDLWVFNKNSKQWTWSSGDKIANQTGVYGIRGFTNGTVNRPGARCVAVIWYVNSIDYDQIWVFGGYGQSGFFNNVGRLNDLWSYNISKHTWVWRSGEAGSDFFGNYSAKGVFADINTPGAREGAVGWTDLGGTKLWLGFGLGKNKLKYGYLNDVLVYDVSKKQWAWQAGSATEVDVSPNATNEPGARWKATACADGSGGLILFGGYSPGGALGDVWRLNPVGNTWSRLKGRPDASEQEKYGRFNNKGITYTGNQPGNRYSAVSWIDKSGALWIFGGTGYAGQFTYGNLNDLWKFDNTQPVSKTATLAGMSVSAGVLTPAFSPAVTNYTTNVAGNVNAVKVSANAADAGATVTVNGAVVNGSAPVDIPLSVGGNNINIVVTATDGISKKNYLINISRAKIPLTATALSASGVSGQPLPQLIIKYTGFEGNETSANLTVQPVISTTAKSSSSPGNYPITLSGGSSNKYEIIYVTGTLTLVSASTATAPVAPKTYGDSDFYLFGKYAPGVTYVSSDPSIATIVADKVHILGAGVITVKTSNGTSSINKTVTINKKKLTVTANDNTKVTGTANPSLTVAYSGFINGDTYTTLTKQPVISTTAATASPAGTYPITVSGAASNKYTISYVPGSLTVVSASTATAPIAPKTYGDNDFYLFGKLAPGVTYGSSNTTISTITEGKVHIRGAGSLTITASNGTNSISKSVTINKRQLIIKAVNKTKSAGAANPPLTVTYTGFVNGDTYTALNKQPVLTTTATAASPAGTYPITVSGAASNNYNFVYENAILTVNNTAVNSMAEADIPHVNKSVSANGDGINDALFINNIERYPHNRLTLINQKGARVFEAAGYDNITNTFAGRSNINGAAQPAGIYFYELEYEADGMEKHDKGYVVLKY